jgi:hypothetical protein
MQYSSIILVAFSASNVFAHGVIDSITGANGVTMPGLSGNGPYYNFLGAYSKET